MGSKLHAKCKGAFQTNKDKLEKGFPNLSASLGFRYQYFSKSADF